MSGLLKNVVIEFRVQRYVFFVIFLNSQYFFYCFFLIDYKRAIREEYGVNTVKYQQKKQYHLLR